MKTVESMTVLIVEDEAELGEALGEAVAGLGYKARLAASGRAALEIVGAGGIDLVISDVRMPGMSGFQLLQEIRASVGHGLPVALMTGFSEIPAWDVYHFGAEAFLAKPIDAKVLAAFMQRTLLAGRELRFSSEAFASPDPVVIGASAFALGRGGLFFQQDRPRFTRAQMLTLQIEAEIGAAPITCVGIVRWLRSSARDGLPAGSGIEVLYAEPESRARLIAMIERRGSMAFIPRTLHDAVGAAA